jgi:PIN domain nuclease of toxin-antitoxin system
MKLLLDTSVWLRAVNQPASVPAKIISLLEDEGQPIGLSAISLWEIGKKFQIGKLPLPVSLDAWFKLALSPQIEILPISSSIVSDAMTLPSFPNHDPVDELIVATARVHQLILLTTDTMLKGYRHARIHYFKPKLS